ncbi:MAG: CPBP family intramembrane metalloprotease [Lachnospiraceae bacterium]|nr:CPBP family intramembrane metalloprotease [Lachnospiraceae bacterium]
MIRWAGRQERLEIPFLQRVWGLVYPWLVYEGVSVLVTFAFAFYKTMTDPSFVATAGSVTDHSLRLSEEVYAYYLPLSVVICLITIPLLLLFISLDRKREQREEFTEELWERPAPWGFALCFFCGVSACVVLNHVLMYSGLYSLLQEQYDDTAQILFQGNLILEIISVGILTPVTEELIFRGLVYRRLRWSADALPAILFSSFVFAVFHGNLLQGIYSFVIGVLLAFVYERTHSLLAPVFVHVGANLVSVVLTEVEGLQSMYLQGNESAFLLMTGGMMLLFVIAFYLFYARIRPARMEENVSAGALDQEQEEQYGT